MFFSQIATNDDGYEYGELVLYADSICRIMEREWVPLLDSYYYSLGRKVGNHNTEIWFTRVPDRFITLPDPTNLIDTGR